MILYHFQMAHTWSAKLIQIQSNYMKIITTAKQIILKYNITILLSI